MKLTYRGIKYKTQKQEATPTFSDSRVALNKDIKDQNQDNQVIQIKPINYFTYRGVSYTKNLFFDSQTKTLLDIDRK